MAQPCRLGCEAARCQGLGKLGTLAACSVCTLAREARRSPALPRDAPSIRPPAIFNIVDLQAASIPTGRISTSGAMREALFLHGSGMPYGPHGRPRAVPGAVTGRPVTAPGCLTACLAPYQAQPDGRRRATRAASKLAARPRNAAHQLERGRPYPHGSPPVRGSRQRQCVERDRRRHKRAYARASALEAAFMADSQVPWGVEALSGTISEPAWRSKPSWYLAATRHRMTPPPAQRQMSGRAGSTVVEAAAGHAIYVRSRSRGRTRRAGRFRSEFSRALRTGFKCRMAFGGLESPAVWQPGVECGCN